MDQAKLLNPTRISFDENKNTLLLSVDKSVIDWDSIEPLARQYGFDPKDELHISIIGFAAGTEIKKAFDRSDARRNNVISQVCSLIDNTDWRFTLKPERYHIEKNYKTCDKRTGAVISAEHRESYIQMVSVPALNNFFKELNRILGTNFLPPPTHITLYTRGDHPERARMGIGINSQDEFISLNPRPI